MEERAPDPRITTLRERIVALARRLRQSASIDDEKWTSLMTLGVIQRHVGAATPTTVREELQLRSSNAASVLRDLEKRRLILRDPDPGDARKVRLSLTTEGLDVLERTRGSRDRWLCEAMKACLNDAEEEHLMQAGHLMERLAGWRRPDS